MERLSGPGSRKITSTLLTNSLKKKQKNTELQLIGFVFYSYIICVFNIVLASSTAHLLNYSDPVLVRGLKKNSVCVTEER